MAAKPDRIDRRSLEALLRTLREFGVSRYSDGAISLEFAATPTTTPILGASPSPLRETEPTAEERRALPTSWADVIDDDGKVTEEVQ